MRKAERPPRSVPLDGAAARRLEPIRAFRAGHTASFWEPLARHQLGSIIATAIDFGTMASLVHGFRSDPVTATAVGALAGGASNFLLGRHWIFGASSGNGRTQAVKYLVVSTGSLGANVVGEYLLCRVLGLQYFFARALTAVAIALLWNYPLQRSFVFRIREST